MDFKDFKEIIERFCVSGEVLDCQPYGNGHINSTYVVNVEGGKRYILQKVNTNVFKKPDQVMSNIYKVTEFLKAHTENLDEVMNLVTLKNGDIYYIKEEDNSFWRMFDFVENSICLELPESESDFYQCAVAFGRFQNKLNDFPVEELYETIPNFHNTVKRYADFLESVENDVMGRAKDVQEEIAFVKARADFYSVLYDNNKAGKLPFRVTHNDTKSNNVMLYAESRKALCVIDLDTIMPGFSVTDFGDAIRFGASTAAEDEKDLSKVWMDINLFEAYAKGFLEGCGGLLQKDEIMLLPEGAKMMTIECGMRFLADYLNGDTYFKTKYPTHNLDRCRTQFKLVADMEAKWDEMKAIINKLV